MPSISGFNQRAVYAWADHLKRTGEKLSYPEVAQRIAEITGTEPLGETAVGMWFRVKDDNGTEPRNLTTTAALAEILGADPGWLAFGDLSQAPKESIKVIKAALRAARNRLPQETE